MHFIFSQTCVCSSYEKPTAGVSPELAPEFRIRVPGVHLGDRVGTATERIDP